MKKISVILAFCFVVFASLKGYAEQGTKWSITADVQQNLSDLIKDNALPSKTSWVVNKEEFEKEQKELKIEAEKQAQEDKAQAGETTATEVVTEEPKTDALNPDAKAESLANAEKVDDEATVEAEKVAESYVHIMQKQDTLYSVAKKYNASLQTILDENNIKDPTTIKEGDRIKISGVMVDKVEPEISEYIYYKIAKGDTLYEISRKFSMGVSDILALNNIKKDELRSKILPGRVLKLKDMGRVSHYEGTDIAQNDKESSDINDKDRFEWPLVGRILQDYGASLNGTINEGINIRAKKNAIVKSSESGTVIYAGKALEAFGSLILVQHDDNWISAYAHLESIMVKKGQKVRKGDSIARVGSTGYVKSPQLHFELRRNSEPVDPLKFLKSYR